MSLERPADLDDAHWEAIITHEQRLVDARERDDRSAVIGSAKELCECVAGVVCASLAETSGTGDDFGHLISAAHAALDRRPGFGAATEEAVRVVASSARQIVMQLARLRNEVGTGHGRPRNPALASEYATISESAARLWCNWALVRLDVVLRGDVATFLDEIRSATVHRGWLGQRFAEVSLASLHSEDQHRIGVAVGWRSSVNGTFVVAEAGVAPLAREAQNWPPSYRAGVAAGLLLDSDGRLALREPYLDTLAAIVNLMDPTAWKELCQKSVGALFSTLLATDHERQQAIATKMVQLAPTLDESRKRPWLELATALGR